MHRLLRLKRETMNNIIPKDFAERLLAVGARPAADARRAQ
jgi:hypothetical protein